MTTGRDIVTDALMKAGIIGVGQSVSPTDANNGIDDLNDLLAQWNTKRWMIFDLLDLSFISTGVNNYTVGPGGNFNVARRPDRLEAAYQRQLIVGGLPVDKAFDIIPSYEEYSRIATKTLVSFGNYAFLQATWPLARLLLYPIPNATMYEIHIVLKDVLPVLTLQSDVSGFPSHYIPCMKYNLAKRLRQAYGKGKTPDLELNVMARDALDTVKQSNLQVSELVMPRALITMSSGYNIFSDQFGQG
jgi:hypothetical protein